MNQCAQARAATSPAPGRRRDRHCRTAIWRRRADSAPLPALDRVWRDRASCHPIILVTKSFHEIGDMRRHALADDIVVHGPELLPDAGLHFAPKTHLAFSLRSGLAHVVMAFRLVFAQSRRLKVNWLTDCHVLSRPRTHQWSRLNWLPLCMVV